MPRTPATRGAEGWASPGRSGEGRTDLDGDFGPLLLLVGRGGTWQQQEEDGAHDEGGGEQHLHIPLEEAQHPPGEQSAARQPRAGRGWGRVGVGTGATTESGWGGTGAPARLLAEVVPISPLWLGEG